MKHLLMTSSSALVLALLIPMAGHTHDAIIGLSPHQAPAVLKAQVERVLQHVTETVEPGEKARIFDAAAAKIITTFAVPNKAIYNNPRAKLQANRQAIGQLKAFMDKAQAVPGKEGALNLPAFLQTIRQNYPAPDGADLIILGSPVFDHARAPSLSMLNGRVPNDGHVSAHLKSSLYGTNGLRGTLKGYDVYMGNVISDWSVSAEHAFYTERFWTLSIEGHGGSLSYFGSDLETLFSLSGKDQPDHQHPEGLVDTDKLEILQFAPDTGVVADIYTTPIAVEPAPEPAWRNASNVTIGITWDAADVDLDLFVRPKPSSPVIFFDNANTADGKLYKDFRASPRTGFETVALTGAFDLSQLRLAVNFYGGRATKGRVSGELRIAIGDKVWAHPFTIDRRTGNKGDGAETAMLENIAPNDGWVIFDPMNILSGE